jgi:hypothetical protein
VDSLALMTDGFCTSLVASVAQAATRVPLTANQAQSLLVKALELPLPDSMTSSYGIFQSDLIIRTALVAAIADMRANPYLLDYVFASLTKDKTTFNDYGEKEIGAAKDWFLKNQIDVRLNVKAGDSPTFPCVTLALLESTEAENTLGDINPEMPVELNDTIWPTLVGPFTPQYNAGTGIMVLPPEAVGVIPLSCGMVVLDAQGKAHRIVEVFDEKSFAIDAGTVADFSNAELRGARPAYITTLESASFRETYSIGVHAMGEPVHCVYLHSIMVFALMRYRQALLEARGFERSSISSSDLRRNDAVEAENVYSRYLTLQGFVRQYWPKAISPRIVAVSVEPLHISGVPKLVSDGTGPADPKNAPWVGVDDEDGGGDLLGGTP